MAELSYVDLDGEVLEIADETAREDIEELKKSQGEGVDAHAAKTADNETSGHVKLSDSINSYYGVNDGFAATPKAVQTVNEKVVMAQNAANAAQATADIATNIAKGRNQSISFKSYQDLVEKLNTMEVDELCTGQNLYIGATGVPDLWIYGTVATKSEYTYVSDDAIVSAIETNVFIQMGYYLISFLETQKVDLTDINAELAKCVKKTDTTVNAGDKAYMRTDSEGGNFGLYSPDGGRWEADANNGNYRLFRYPTVTEEQISYWFQKNGCFIAHYGIYANKVLSTSDNKAGMTTNEEGGNFWLIDPDGYKWEADAFNGYLRIFRYNDDGTIIAFTFAPDGRILIGDKAVALQSAVEELKKSVSDGKSLVASAITGKGVTTAADATFATMANNIGQIGGYKFYSKVCTLGSSDGGTWSGVALSNSSWVYLGTVSTQSKWRYYHNLNLDPSKVVALSGTIREETNHLRESKADGYRFMPTFSVTAGLWHSDTGYARVYHVWGIDSPDSASSGDADIIIDLYPDYIEFGFTGVNNATPLAIKSTTPTFEFSFVYQDIV